MATPFPKPYRVKSLFHHLLKAHYTKDARGHTQCLFDVYVGNLRSGGKAFPQRRFQTMIETLYKASLRQAYQEALQARRSPYAQNTQTTQHDNP